MELSFLVVILSAPKAGFSTGFGLATFLQTRVVDKYEQLSIKIGFCLKMKRRYFEKPVNKSL